MSVKLMLYNIVGEFHSSSNICEDVISKYKFEIVKPGIWQLNSYGYGLIVNVFWYIFTLNNYRILTLYDKNIQVHFSYLIPKVYRFPFMMKSDLQIGPCFTAYNYRRRGIYLAVLRFLIKQNIEKYRTIWIYCAETNIASQKAIEKAGFSFYGKARISKTLKIIKHIRL